LVVSCLLRWIVREGSCKGLDAGFGLQIQSCTHLQRLARNPWRKPLATISTKGCIDTDRVYQPGFAVYITLAIYFGIYRYD
jgi:hypothetical protein